MQRVIVLGAGGHGQVVADILLSARDAGEAVELLGFLDDDPGLTGASVGGLPVLGQAGDLDRIPHDAVILGIGDNRTRQRLMAALLKSGEHFTVARHPSAIIARNVTIGAGSMICAGAVVNTGSSIGRGTILNTHCSVDHHNQIGECVHVAPGAHLGGDVIVEDGALIGIGATVMPQQRVGAWSCVGAGAVVTKSVPPGATVAGVPARPLQR
jgi:sugar O-acyltransferase (sialic acid O-acetyltransferase NeuD family)